MVQHSMVVFLVSSSLCPDKDEAVAIVVLWLPLGFPLDQDTGGEGLCLRSLVPEGGAAGGEEASLELGGPQIEVATITLPVQGCTGHSPACHSVCV